MCTVITGVMALKIFEFWFCDDIFVAVYEIIKTTATVGRKF